MMNGKAMPEKAEKVKEDFASYVCSSKAQLAGELEAGSDKTYNPADHRNFKHALGTRGALFHMIKGSLGSGILSMPVAFKNGGLWVSLVGTIFVGIICTHSVQILVYCSQELSKKVKQPSLGYAATAEAAFANGPIFLRKYSTFVREFVDLTLMLTYYLGNTVYIIFITSSFQNVIENHYDIELSPRLYILMLSVILIPVGLIRQLKYLVPFSFVAIIFLLFGCGFVLYEVFSDLPPITSRPAFTSFQRLPLFYATVLFALEGIGTVFPIENAMKKPRHFLGVIGVLNIAMVLLTVMYALIGFFGYLRYGEATQGSVTLNLNSSVIGETVKLLVALNVLCSYGLCFCVPFDVTWRKVEPRVSEKFKNTANYITRVSLVVGTLAIACVVPELEPFVGLVGAICYSTLGLMFPAVIDIITFWNYPEHFGFLRWRLFKDIFLMVMWLVALTAGTEASISKIFETVF